MSKVFYGFDEKKYGGKIKILRWHWCIKHQGQTKKIRLGKHFKQIKITKNKNEEGPEYILINIIDANADSGFQVKVNDSLIEYPYSFTPEDSNWERIKIGISYKRPNGNKKVNNGYGDPDTTVTIGDAKPSDPIENKKKKR